MDEVEEKVATGEGAILFRDKVPIPRFMLALFLLAPLMIFRVITLIGEPYDAVVAKLSSPLWGGVALLFVCASFYHAHLGLQVVIEDYIGGHAARLTMIILIRGALIILGLIAVLSVLRLMLT